MKTKKFSIEEAVDTGFNKTVDNIYFFLTALLIIGLTALTSFSISGLFTQYNFTNEMLFLLRPIFEILFFVLGLFFSVLTAIGLIKISLTILNGGKARLADLFLHYRLIINYIICSILYILITILGVVFFIIPGLILGTRFSLAGYYIVDQRMGPITALKKSFVDTKGVTLSLYSLLMILSVVLFFNAILSSLLNFAVESIAINLLTAIFSGLTFTILLSYPLMTISLAHVYRKLSTKDSEEVLEEKLTQETEKDLETATS